MSRKSVRRMAIVVCSLTVCTGIVAAAGTSEAQQGSSSREGLPSFSKADQDNNKFVDAAEASAAGVDIGSIDANGDGRLDESEWERARGTRPAPDGERSRSY